MSNRRSNNMTKVRPITTCYMPQKANSKVMVRYEDWHGDERDSVEIPDDRVEEFLSSRNFVLVG